jgi:hypothetical protein
MPYIYAHYIEGEKDPFYIGKGTGSRAWNSSERNKYWHDKIKKHHGNFSVKILEENLTEKQAYKREKEIIKEYGLENLTNVLPGGEYGFTSEYMKDLWQKPEYREKASQPMIKQWQDPKYRERMSNFLRDLNKDPEVLKKKSEITKKLWSDPAFRKKVATGVAARSRREQKPHKDTVIICKRFFDFS